MALFASQSELLKTTNVIFVALLPNIQVFAINDQYGLASDLPADRWTWSIIDLAAMEYLRISQKAQSPCHGTKPGPAASSREFRT